MKIKPPKAYPAPWHLEGPFDLDGQRWGADIAIVASNGTAVLYDWSSDRDWVKLATYLVRSVNREAGFSRVPLRIHPRIQGRKSS